MIDFEGVPYEPHYSPVEDEDEWETVYPSEAEEYEQSEVKPTTDDPDGYMSDWNDLMDVAKAITNGKLAGEATGNEVVAVVASVLENGQRYYYELSFDRLTEA